MGRGRGRFTAGILLIALGILILLRNLDLWWFSWHELRTWGLTAFGVILFVVGYIHHSRGKVFAGSLLFLYGSLGILREFHIIHPFLTEIWPLYLVIFGISFTALYPIGPRDLASMVVGLFFIATGVLLFMVENRFFPALTPISVRETWPFFIILLGSILLLVSFLRRPDPRLEADNASTDSASSAEPSEPVSFRGLFQFGEIGSVVAGTVAGDERHTAHRPTRR